MTSPKKKTSHSLGAACRSQAQPTLISLVYVMNVVLSCKYL